MSRQTIVTVEKRGRNQATNVTFRTLYGHLIEGSLLVVVLVVDVVETLVVVVVVMKCTYTGRGSLLVGR